MWETCFEKKRKIPKPIRKNQVYWNNSISHVATYTHTSNCHKYLESQCTLKWCVCWMIVRQEQWLNEIPKWNPQHSHGYPECGVINTFLCLTGTQGSANLCHESSHYENYLSVLVFFLVSWGAQWTQGYYCDWEEISRWARINIGKVGTIERRASRGKVNGPRANKI